MLNHLFFLFPHIYLSMGLYFNFVVSSGSSLPCGNGSTEVDLFNMNGAIIIL